MSLHSNEQVGVFSYACTPTLHCICSLPCHDLLRACMPFRKHQHLVNFSYACFTKLL
jgi:hypothetical protein